MNPWIIFVLIALGIIIVIRVIASYSNKTPKQPLSIEEQKMFAERLNKLEEEKRWKRERDRMEEEIGRRTTSHFNAMGSGGGSNLG